MAGAYRQAVYEYLTRIPRGKVVTYGQIAAHLGDPALARAVGNILHANPDGVKYPCYKVVSAGGYLSENYAFGGLSRQQALLEKEDIPVENGRVDMKRYQWK